MKPNNQSIQIKSILKKTSNKQITITIAIVTTLIVAVVVSFFICWSPFHAQRLLANYLVKTESTNQLLIDICSKLTYISGIMYYLSSTINPILYQLMSAKFRLAFKETFNCSPLQCLKLYRSNSSKQYKHNNNYKNNANLNWINTTNGNKCRRNTATSASSNNNNNNYDYFSSHNANVLAAARAAAVARKYSQAKAKRQSTLSDSLPVSAANSEDKLQLSKRPASLSASSSPIKQTNNSPNCASKEANLANNCADDKIGQQQK